MKILIVEDSQVLVKLYTEIIGKILKNIDHTIINVVNYSQYTFFKDFEFDLAIFDWNIQGENSSRIVEECHDKIRQGVFITGYTLNKTLNMISKRYNFEIISKPTSEFEIREIFKEALELLEEKMLEMDKVV